MQNILTLKERKERRWRQTETSLKGTAGANLPVTLPPRRDGCQAPRPGREPCKRAYPAARKTPYHSAEGLVLRRGTRPCATRAAGRPTAHGGEAEPGPCRAPRSRHPLTATAGMLPEFSTPPVDNSVDNPELSTPGTVRAAGGGISTRLLSRNKQVFNTFLNEKDINLLILHLCNADC